MTERDEILAGLKLWAIGSYPAQAAVTFLAGTDEPLNRVWITKYGDPDRGDDRYWLDWDRFDKHGGGLSGGEYATWALARSLHEGELQEQLYRLDPDRTKAFAVAIATCRENWR